MDGRFKEAVTGTPVVSAWSEDRLRVDLVNIGTVSNQTLIELPLRENLVYRRVYFGFALSCPTPDVLWDMPLKLTLLAEGGPQMPYVMRAYRHVGPPNQALKLPKTTAFPSFTCRWFSPAAQDWCDSDAAVADGVQFFSHDADTARECIVTSAPFRVSGAFTKIVLDMDGTPASTAVGSERVTWFLGVHSQNLPA